jgi:hypothetical protein
MITDEDRKAAEEWVKDNFGWYDGCEGFLAGIEHERKRQEMERANDLKKTIEACRLPDDLIKAMGLARDNMIVGFPKAVIHCTDGDLEFPFEQVGEKHWRIKDGHE